ncbi:MAG: hypothetical protein O7C75_19925 [Verrucomicrobia bacterium]|nr:hypothetical protein [Verrucomicrobiota bacterium]
MKQLNTTRYFIALLVLSFCLAACQSFVDGVDPLTSRVEDELLTTEDQVPFLITGVLGGYGISDEGEGVPWLIWRIAGYSDEKIHGMFDGAPDHFTFVQDGPADLDFYENDWDNYHTIRFFADDLVARVGAIGSFDDTALRDRALWWGNFIGGLMRMYLADHWGAQAEQGNTPGAPITTREQLDNGEFGAFFSSTELRQQARDKFNAAMGFDPGDVDNPDEVLWSFIARTHIFDGNDAQAKTAAESGLQQGESFGIFHTSRFENYMWNSAGRGNDPLFSAHPRFAQYVLDDAKEGVVLSELTADDVADGKVSRFGRPIEGGDGQPGHRDTVDPRAGLANQDERLPLWERPIRSLYGQIRTSTWADYSSGTGLSQDIYHNRDGEFFLIDWREMELILAEVAINGGDDATGLIHINNVRSFHSLDEITPAEMAAYDNPLGGASTTGIALRGDLPVNNITGALGLLIEERDKTLWMKGTRIADQARFNLWHLPAGKFRNYMPIPRSETNVNPNVPGN